jgi:hypothetical protein
MAGSLGRTKTNSRACAVPSGQPVAAAVACALSD